jgi:hypothetical protein
MGAGSRGLLQSVALADGLLSFLLCLGRLDRGFEARRRLSRIRPGEDLRHRFLAAVRHLWIVAVQGVILWRKNGFRGKVVEGGGLHNKTGIK